MNVNLEWDPWGSLLFGVVPFLVLLAGGLVLAHRWGRRFGERGFMWGWIATASTLMIWSAARFAVLFAFSAGLDSLMSWGSVVWFLAAGLATASIRKSQRASPAAPWPSVTATTRGIGAFIVGYILSYLPGAVWALWRL